MGHNYGDMGIIMKWKGSNLKSGGDDEKDLKKAETLPGRNKIGGYDVCYHLLVHSVNQRAILEHTNRHREAWTVLTIMWFFLADPFSNWTITFWIFTFSQRFLVHLKPLGWAYKMLQSACTEHWYSKSCEAIKMVVVTGTTETWDLSSDRQSDVSELHPPPKHTQHSGMPSNLCQSI